MKGGKGPKKTWRDQYLENLNDPDAPQERVETAAEKLAAEDPPVGAEYLLDRYIRIRGCAARGMGIEPITPAHIEAYCRLYRYSLEAWEVTLLLAMDAAWMEEVAKFQEKPDA